MRSHISKGIALIIGLVVFVLVSYTGQSYVVYAGPLLNITGTPEEPLPPDATSAPEATSAPHDQPTSPPDATAEAPDKPDKHDDGNPDLVLVKTIDQSTVTPGELIGFSLHVTNEGNKTARDVVVTDSSPNYLSLLDYSTTKGSVSMNGQTITANIGTVSPGEYVIVRLRAYVSASAPAEGSNTSTITSSNDGGDSDNNTSTVGFTINQPVLTATAVPPTSVPAVAPPAPSPTAQPAPRPPRGLPPTGESTDPSNGIGLNILLLIIALGSIGFGFVLRRRVKTN